MKTYKKRVLLCAMMLGFGTPYLFAETKSDDLLVCEKKYKALEDEYFAYEQDTRVSLYDYIEGNMDHERDMNEINTCLKLQSADAIRKCVKPIIAFYVQ